MRHVPTSCIFSFSVTHTDVHTWLSTFPFFLIDLRVSANYRPLFPLVYECKWKHVALLTNAIYNRLNLGRWQQQYKPYLGHYFYVCWFLRASANHKLQSTLLFVYRSWERLPLLCKGTISILLSFIRWETCKSCKVCFCLHGRNSELCLYVTDCSSKLSWLAEQHVLAGYFSKTLTIS